MYRGSDDFVIHHTPIYRSQAGRRRDQTFHAFTLVELLVTVAIIGIVASLLLPVLQKGFQRAKRTACASQLKQIGVAFHSWAHDHNDLYPPQVPMGAGGTREFARETVSNPNESFNFRHFQALSNELGLARVLLCPSEMRRVPASDFFSLRNQNISYWVNSSASFEQPNTPLCGDRNVRTSGRTEWTFIEFGPSDTLEFSAELHGYRGNVLFSDAHVEDADNRTLRMAFARDTNHSYVALSLPVQTFPTKSEPAVHAIGGSELGAIGSIDDASSSKPSGVRGNAASAKAENRSGNTRPGSDQETVVITRLDGTTVTSSVPRRFTNTAANPTSERQLQQEKDPPIVELAQSIVHTIERATPWLWLLLLLLVAYRVANSVRRRLRRRRPAASP